MKAFSSLESSGLTSWQLC